MFYSHEILSNSQYGVATIWLVATVGKVNNRKVTKKAIQEVNVPKACEKIIEPGAPLALRLQGNLLYGVSRVFSHQCGYVLSDAEKTQSDMMTFFRVVETTETDPKAGRAKRHQITLQDDPNFDPLSTLPKLDLFSSPNDLVLLSSQFSSQKISQFSPLRDSQGTPSSGGNPALFELELPPSSHSAESYHLPSDFGHQSSPYSKMFGNGDPMDEYNPFGENEIDLMGGINLDFDDNGNLIGIVDEPELPPLPGSVAHSAQIAQQGSNVNGNHPEQRLNPGGDEDMLILGEEGLPDAEPFPKRQTVQPPRASPTQATETLETEQVTAPSKRAPRRKRHIELDERQQISAAEFRSWQKDYLQNMDANRKRPKLTMTQAQARRNAVALLYDNGVANIGLHRQYNHPLAEFLSGVSLRARLQGRYPDENEQLIEERRGRRRSSSEAFGDKEEDLEQRRVKQKVDQGPHVGRRTDEHLGAPVGDDTAPELGMQAVPEMEDHHSSSMMPWSRPPSVVRGSSVHGHGSAQKGMPAPSPLLGRGSVARSIERYSDVPGSALNSDDFTHIPSQVSSLDLDGVIGDLDFAQVAAAPDTQISGAGLDVPSQEFLGYATQQAQSKGYTQIRDTGDRRWVDFESLADPTIHDKGVAAQAFLHVLSLATKNAIAVKQDGIDEQQPFGTIRIGINMPTPATSYYESEDELA